MNIELIKQIRLKGYNNLTEAKVIRNFLNVEISSKEYLAVIGEDLEDKLESIMNYLENLNPVLKEKSILNLVIANDEEALSYVKYLETEYKVIVHKVDSVKIYSSIDLVLFTGGEDVNPAMYGENKGDFTHFNENRDKNESKVFEKFAGIVPFLAICRGSQFLTVKAGGKLIQDVTGHCQDHDIIIHESLRYRMTSSHHQMLYPFDMRKEDYKLVAYSEYFRSGHYLNGNNENIELHNDFLEAEIVYYPKIKALCIQGHPEYSHCRKETKEKCLSLIKHYLFNDKRNFKNLDLLYNENNNNYQKENQIYYIDEYNDSYEDKVTSL